LNSDGSLVLQPVIIEPVGGIDFIVPAPNQCFPNVVHIVKKYFSK